MPAGFTDELPPDSARHHGPTDDDLLPPLRTLLPLRLSAGQQGRSRPGLDRLLALQYLLHNHLSHDSHVADCCPSTLSIHSGLSSRKCAYLVQPDSREGK